MKHRFQSAKADGADSTLVQPSSWNETHVLAWTGLSANTTLDSTHDGVKATAGAGGITLTLPTAVGVSGRPYFIKKVDSAVGAVTLATTASQTIDGATTLALLQQNEWVQVTSDGANWLVTARSTFIQETVFINGGTNVIAAALAANRRLYITASVTESAAISITQNNVVIECAPGVKITRSAATDLFDVSGNDVRIINCNLDGGSQTAASTGPLLNISGNRCVVRDLTITNPGITSPMKAAIWITAGVGHDIGPVFIASISDQVVWVTPAASTTISDCTIHDVRVDSWTPSGTSAMSAMQMDDQNSGAFVVRVTWKYNQIKGTGVGVTGANATWFAHNINLPDINLQRTSSHHTYVGNRAIVTGTGTCGQTLYKWFGCYHNTYTDNTTDDSDTAVVSQHFACGDSYYCSFKGNIVRNRAGSGTSFQWTDFGWCSITGNISDGVGTTGFGFFTIGGIGQHSVISGNIALLFAGANIGFSVNANDSTAGQELNDNIFTENIVTGTGTAGQKGFSLVLTAGALKNNFISGNHFLNVPIAISIGSGVIGTKVGLNYYDTVTTTVSDSGTNTFIDLPSHVGTAILDFGAFPGASDATVVITGQIDIVAGTVVRAWIMPAATPDHTADEHLVEQFEVFAGNIVAGTGFTIYGVNFNPPSQNDNPLVYGKWNIGWQWV